MNCECCAYTATTKQRMNLHLLSKKHLQQGILQDDCIYMCDKCDYVTHVKGNFKIHCLSDAHLDIKKTKAPVVQMTCEQCNYSTYIKSSFDIHLLSKKHNNFHVKETFTCEQCSLTTTEKQVYEKHCLSKKHIHFNDVKETYTCEQCSLTTSNKHVYEKHCLSKRHIHFNDVKETFTCISCNFTTSNKHVYEKHCSSKKHESTQTAIRSYDIELNLAGLTDKIRQEDDVILFLCKTFIINRKCIKQNYVFTNKWIKNEQIIAELYDRIKVAYMKASSKEQIENMKCSYNFDELHSIL